MDIQVVVGDMVAAADSITAFIVRAAGGGDRLDAGAQAVDAYTAGRLTECLLGNTYTLTADAAPLKRHASGVTVIDGRPRVLLVTMGPRPDRDLGSLMEAYRTVGQRIAREPWAPNSVLATTVPYSGEDAARWEATAVALLAGLVEALGSRSTCQIRLYTRESERAHVLRRAAQQVLHEQTSTAWFAPKLRVLVYFQQIEGSHAPLVHCGMRVKLVRELLSASGIDLVDRTHHVTMSAELEALIEGRPTARAIPAELATGPAVLVLPVRQVSGGRAAVRMMRRHHLLLFADAATPRQIAQGILLALAPDLRLNAKLPPNRLLNPDGTGSNFSADEVRRLWKAKRALNPGEPARLERRNDTLVFTPGEDDTAEDAVTDLGGLVGQPAAKQTIRSLANLLRVNGWRQHIFAIGSDIPHVILIGPPGSGRSTVAHLLGRLYRGLGTLSNGQVVEVTGELLVLAQLDRAKDGVLFVDGLPEEHHRESRSYLGLLLDRVAGGEVRTALVLGATTESEVERFLANSPLLSPRFTQRLTLRGFSAADLQHIVERRTEQHKLLLSTPARSALSQLLKAAVANGETSTNGHYAEHLVALALQRQADRLADIREPTPADLSCLFPEDLTSPPPGRLHRDVTPVEATDEALEDVLRDLDGLVGLSPVKSQVRSLVNVLATRQHRVLHGLPVHPISYHMTFSGPPGTGKTTVARLVGRILRCLGVLSRGHLVETDRAGLIAGFMGQTGLKTQKLVDQAVDGVLFVDEAHSLIGTGLNDYGHEAVVVLAKRMEDERHRLAVILAGYSEPLARLLDSNPGLRSRVAHPFEFTDYEPTELLAIFDHFCRQAAYELAPAAREQVRQELTQLYRHRTASFGNGRDVRVLFEKALMRQAERFAGRSVVPREELTELTVDDIPTWISMVPRIVAPKP